jgi:ABC-type transport system involved in multi-copper enzyme maturation permease subunit
MNSVSRNTVLLGKAIGGYVSLTVPLSIAFFLGIIVLGNLDPDVFQAQYLAPILLIYLLSILFVAVYFGIGVAVSSSTTHVRSAIIISVSIWIFLQMVLPKIGSMIARTVSPVPSEVIKSVEKEQVRNAVAKEEGEETANASLSFWGRLPLATDVQDGARWERWKQIQLPIRLKYEDRLSELLRAKNRQYEQIEKDQEAVAVWISTMSPSFALSNVICDIAGTGRLSANKFLKDVRNFEHVVAQQVYSSGFVQRTLVDGEVNVLKQSSTERIKEIPRFSHNPPSLEETIAENLSSIIVLWMWLVISILAAYLWFYHYDLR